MEPTGLEIEIPGRETLRLRELVLDFSGTLACDGELLPGVAERLTALAEKLRVTVLTADTFGRASQALAGLPLGWQVVPDGEQKARFVQWLGAHATAAIGNGRNDAAMADEAALGIAVIGPEGACAELLRAADVVVRDIRDALDLLLQPKRLIATLRG